MSIVLFLIVSVIVALIATSSCYIQYNRLRISREKEESEKKELNRKERRMYYSNIILLAIITIYMYMAKSTLAIISVFIIGLSIIARALNSKKIANILCWIIIIPMLISPMFVFMGISIFNMQDNDSTVNQMTEFEISAFNSKFTQYEGRKSGTQVKALLNCNKNNPKNGTGISITGIININSTDTNENNIKNSTDYKSIENTKRYKITCHESENGFVEKIEIDAFNVL